MQAVILLQLLGVSKKTRSVPSAVLEIKKKMGKHVDLFLFIIRETSVDKERVKNKLCRSNSIKSWSYILFIFSYGFIYIYELYNT